MEFQKTDEIEIRNIFPCVCALGKRTPSFHLGSPKHLLNNGAQCSSFTCHMQQ